MPRLGELLVAARLLSLEQVEQALRAQVVWGGRLGTNLVELGFIDLDGLSRALGRQHGLPAALERHFEKADPELQRKIEPEQAERWEIIPLLRVGPDEKVAIASMGPLTTATRFAIAQALDIEARELVISVAAEQRMRYQLERVYGIARSARFLRARGPTIPPFPDLEFENEATSEAGAAIPVEIEPPASEPVVAEPATADPPEAVPEPVPAPGEVSVQPPEALAAMIDEATAQASVPPPADDEPSGRARRTYVKTLADSGEPCVAAPEAKALGRIAIRKVATNRIPTVAERGAGSSLPDATRAIRRGAHRDRVAELVVSTIERFAPACEAAMLMVVRGEAVIGWKAFSRAGHALPELAVPLNEPGLVPRAIESNAIARCAPGELGELDRKLLGAMGTPEGELVVIPIAISDHVMCVIAAALGPDAPVAVLEAVAKAAGTAFARLIREASR